jgi:hypothetical protein
MARFVSGVWEHASEMKHHFNKRAVQLTGRWQLAGCANT